ncbi:MAG: penicillin-binding protein 1A [Woeseiaceae bacterium]
MQNEPTTRGRSRTATRRPRRRALRWLILLAGLGLTASIGATAGVIGAYLYVAPSLPRAETIRDIPLQIPLRIFSRDGRLIEEVGERRRVLVDYEDLPNFVVDAFVAAEDGRFFDHPGIDYQGIIRALVQLIGTGEIKSGGSTITQQLARDYFLTREQTFIRKLREAFLAYAIEQAFSKEEIMALFVNKMFFGQRAYGVAAAAQVYFGKNLGDINIAEAATLAGVLPAPSDYNPVRNATEAGNRRTYVLNRMHGLGHINTSQLREALEYPVESKLHGTANELSAPYVAEMVRREMLSRYGEATYSAGYRVITTLDSHLQIAGNYAVRNGLFEFTRRRGYRGPLASVDTDPAILGQPYIEWPDELQQMLQDYGNPAGMSVAVVTRINEDNTADIVLQNGTRTVLPWHGISWAKPFIDRETAGPVPETADEVLAAGDIIYVMPITVGGWALAQLPEAQSALVSVDPHDAAITSLVGGLDFSLSKFNRASQSARQPGSSFKPFIYSAALEAGNTLATIILDAPVVINSSALERLWRPVNYSGRFYGEQRVREAMVRSMNLASVRLLLNNTGIGFAVNYLAPFGFNDSALPRNGSLALGGGNASPLDMAQAYATFANGGYAVKPYVIDAIIGPDDEILYRAEPVVVCADCEIDEDLRRRDSGPRYPVRDQDTDIIAGVEPGPEIAQALPIGEKEQLAMDAALIAKQQAELEKMADIGQDFRPDVNQAPELFENVKTAERIITPQNAFLIQDAMRHVIRRGTGVRANVLGRTDLSGKTGTSNDRRDAWFAGFNADVVSIVWVGYDDDLPLGPREEGSRTALPIWIDFAKIALDDVPNNQMAMPEGIVTVRISKSTGCPAGANHPFEDVMFELFREDHVPVCEESDTVEDIFNSSGDDGALF